MTSSTRVLAARWSPARATHKKVLVQACEAAGITPRPNWLHPSIREMRDAIEPVAGASGVVIVGTIDSTQTTGTRADYQSTVRWAVRHSKASSAGVIRYDVRTGRVSARLPEAAFGEFRAALPAALEAAELGAQIHRVDARNEMAVVLMDALPLAPFCTLPQAGPGLWMLAIDSPEFNKARRFLSRVDTPALDLSEIDGPPVSLQQAVQKSHASADTRFGTRTGWRSVADRSHAALAEAVTNLGDR